MGNSSQKQFMGEASSKKTQTKQVASSESKNVTNSVPGELVISTITEFSEAGLQAKIPFHVRVSLVFNPVQMAEEEKNALDVVCILDNSGSMTGEKIANLKRAMEFVISTLSNKDRLSVTTFNHTATNLHTLINLTDGEKAESLSLIRNISAEGGTNIYEGMKAGWRILQERKTKNPTSCMFLLTDGQDESYLAEKKQLAKTMREQGTSLFVFGFGRDHDSAHLLEIANAGEGSFVYVETNDTVIDAFGGAIGTQQGQLLRNIEVEFQMSSKNVLIENILAGSYLQEMDTTWRRSGKVKFADLYGGEKRDFLIQLRLPEIESAEENYDLFSIQVQYQKYGDDKTVLRTPPTGVAVRRNANVSATQVRNAEVDEQIQRLEVTKCIQEAIASADKNDYTNGKALLKKMKAQVKSAAAYQAGNSLVKGLEEELKECEEKISSRDVYEYGGGRAKMCETTEVWSKQRAVFSKNAYTTTMQAKSSVDTQESACDYRKTTSTESDKFFSK